MATLIWIVCGYVILDEIALQLARDAPLNHRSAGMGRGV